VSSHIKMPTKVLRRGGSDARQLSSQVTPTITSSLGRITLAFLHDRATTTSKHGFQVLGIKRAAVSSAIGKFRRQTIGTIQQ